MVRALVSELEEQFSGVETLPEERTAVPHRCYALYRDVQPAPATYAEVAPDGGDGAVPVIVHNLRYYEQAMERWDVDFIELLVLNELHELTHWAMTDRERERFETKSETLRLPDGYWMNATLFRIIEWLPGEHPAVIEPEPPLWKRIGAAVRERLFGAPATDAD